jgi:hypothetical protein
LNRYWRASARVNRPRREAYHLNLESCVAFNWANIEVTLVYLYIHVWPTEVFSGFSNWWLLLFFFISCKFTIYSTNWAISKYVERKHLCGAIIPWWCSYVTVIRVNFPTDGQSTSSF